MVTLVVPYLGWVDMDCDVPLSANFFLGICEFGNSDWAGGLDHGTSKSKSTQPRWVTTRVTLYFSPDIICSVFTILQRGRRNESPYFISVWSGNLRCPLQCHFGRRPAGRPTDHPAVSLFISAKRSPGRVRRRVQWALKAKEPSIYDVNKIFRIL